MHPTQRRRPRADAVYGIQQLCRQTLIPDSDPWMESPHHVNELREIDQTEVSSVNSRNLGVTDNYLASRTFVQ